jgi:hypothetical protein
VIFILLGVGSVYYFNKQNNSSLTNTEYSTNTENMIHAVSQKLDYDVPVFWMKLVLEIKNPASLSRKIFLNQKIYRKFN